jgi:hypothetical protein
MGVGLVMVLGRALRGCLFGSWEDRSEKHILFVCEREMGRWDGVS